MMNNSFFLLIQHQFIDYQVQYIILGTQNPEAEPLFTDGIFQTHDSPGEETEDHRGDISGPIPQI